MYWSMASFSVAVALGDLDGVTLVDAPLEFVEAREDAPDDVPDPVKNGEYANHTRRDRRDERCFERSHIYMRRMINTPSRITTARTTQPKIPPGIRRPG